jgi:ubiquinol-cytochrome c reductase cytochrome b subunit
MTGKEAMTVQTQDTGKDTGKIGEAADWLDDRTGVAALAKKYLRKVFPDHWSFMLGEIALWSFVVLLLTGTLLSLWFKPSMAETTYNGSYDLLRGLKVSDAFASTMNISFDVRGGLLLRQTHHWAANIFIAAMLVHMMRVFVSGAFRKPREVNWMIGGTLLVLGIVEGFAGYSLPDDLLSGTGLRIAEGLMLSIPVVGTYVAFFVFGGQFPGDDIVSRLYIAHVLFIPALLMALIGAHMMLLLYQKHTQWPGPGHTNANVVGYPLTPVYAAKSGGYFFIVFGIAALMGGILTINPIWQYGPYEPNQVTADSQPDWYMGVPEGLLRIMPGWETHAFGFTLSWNVFIPGVLMPGVILTTFLVYPFIEAWASGDRREHHLLQRPRNAPTRTAFLVAMMTVYGLLWAAGGNDVLALVFHSDIYHIIAFIRVAVFVGPVVAFIVTRRWCLSLQRGDRERMTHGAETGAISRSPDGAYSETHRPLSPPQAYVAGLPSDANRALPAAVTDGSGHQVHDADRPDTRRERLRHAVAGELFGLRVPRPRRADDQRVHDESAHDRSAPGRSVGDRPSGHRRH